MSDLLLKEDLSTEEFNNLKQEEQAVWISRPRRIAITHTRRAMMMRVVIISAALIYSLYNYARSEISILFGVIYLYEFAYYHHAKRIADDTYNRDLARYYEQVSRFRLEQTLL